MNPQRIILTASALLFLFTSSVSLAQTSMGSPSTSSPQALKLAAQSMQALTGGVSVSDVTLTGTTSQLSGFNAGSAVLQAVGYQESRMDANDAGLHEVHGLDANGVAQGAWTGPDGKSHATSLHNSWTDTAWFFPPLSSLGATSRPDVVASYVSQETVNGRSVQHVRFQRNISGQTATVTAQIMQFSMVDVYLDAATLLPAVMRFQTHPDDNAATNIPVEVDFSNYQITNGLQVPFHIQKYMNGNLIFDFTVSSVAVNSGLSASNFSIQ